MFRMLAFSATAAAAAIGPAAAATQCGPSEKVIFSCQAGADVVSVCAAGSGALSYRFGPLGRPEMTWPPPESWRDDTRSGTWMFSGGGGAWLAFHRDAYRYVVYTAIGRGWGTKEGVAVEENGKLISNRRCTTAPDSELGQEFFDAGKIQADAKGFDLP